MNKITLAAVLALSLFSRLFAREDLDFPRLCEKAINDLHAKSSAHESLWGLGHAERWDLNQKDGRLIFTFPDKIVSCPAQIIGTWHRPSQTWRWAWSNQSVEKPLTAHSEMIRAYGAERKIEQLITAKWSAAEEDAWQMAALACVIGDAQGIYRGPAGETFVFIAFGKPEIRKK
ncbi:MAG TPA: hypothetical protein VEB66_17350 [Opitutaceae bacterium]|nr:hypothetical protein [Opitutaceae bacterium]